MFYWATRSEGTDAEQAAVRRRRSLVVLLLAAVVVFGGTVVVAYLARPEDVVGLTNQVVVANNESASVTETIDYRFSGFAKHGIYRDISGIAPYGTVSATVDGTAADFEESEDDSGSGTVIRVGDSHHRISGDHVYGLTYTLDSVGGADGSLGWTGLKDWTVKVEHADLDIAGPWAWTDVNCRLNDGSSCTAVQPEPGLLTVHLDHVAAHDLVTISADRGAALTAAPTLPSPAPARWPPLGPSPFATGAAAATAVVLAGLAGLLLFERLRRHDVALAAEGGVVTASVAAVPGVDDRQLAEMASTQSTPPEGLTAWQGGIIRAERVLEEHKAAWLVESSIAGYLTIDEDDGVITLTRPSLPGRSHRHGGRRSRRRTRGTKSDDERCSTSCSMAEKASTSTPTTSTSPRCGTSSTRR
jgi:hypothetical protein